jgi:hypothetical protein
MNNWKKVWEHAGDNAIELTPILLHRKKSNSIVGRVRKNMRNEGILWTLLMLAGALAIALELSSIGKSNIIGLFFGISLLFFLFYMQKFFRFFRKSNQLDLNLLKNVYWFYYELKLGIEMYRALMFLQFFIGFSAGIAASNQHWSELHPLDLSILFGFMAILLGFMIGLNEIWIRYMYGKHLLAFKRLMEEMEEIETDDGNESSEV